MEINVAWRETDHLIRIIAAVVKEHRDTCPINLMCPLALNDYL
jgi:hypothetical protein